MFIILKHAHFLLGGRAWSLHSSYTLYPDPPLTGVPMLDLLVLEALKDPTRNAIYKLDPEKSAQIAQSLWLSVLPS